MWRSFISRGKPKAVTRRLGNFPHYDICVIGSGPAGLSTAMRAANLKKKVCIVEAGHVGGSEVQNGVYHTALLWEMSKLAMKMTDHTGVAGRLLNASISKSIKDSLDPRHIQETLSKLVAEREVSLRSLIEASAIDLIRGLATFSSPHEIDIHTSKTGEYSSLRADNFVIATGVVPREHNLCPFDHRRILSCQDMGALGIPKSLVIIGAGSWGCTFASIFANLGLTRVHLVDQGRRILAQEDDDVAQWVQEKLLRHGVTLHKDCHLFDLEAYDDAEGNDCRYAVQDHKTGAVETFLVERALVTVGHRPNYKALGLENIKMQVKNGKLEVDQYNRCIPYKHIYCIGGAIDAKGTVSQAQLAGRAAANDICGRTYQRLFKAGSLGGVSHINFFDEEVARVGLTERECRERQIGYMVAKYSNALLPRAQILGETEGFTKLIVTNDREKRVLGALVIGNQAGSVAELASIPIHNRSSIYDFFNLGMGYPSLAASLEECARLLGGRSSSHHSSSATKFLSEWRPRNVVPEND